MISRHFRDKHESLGTPVATQSSSAEYQHDLSVDTRLFFFLKCPGMYFLKASAAELHQSLPPPLVLTDKKLAVEYFWGEMQWKCYYWFMCTVFIYLAVLD